MIDIEIDRQKRLIRIYDLDKRVSEGGNVPEKFMPITFNYLEKLLEFKDPLKMLQFFQEIKKAIKWEVE